VTRRRVRPGLHQLGAVVLPPRSRRACSSCSRRIKAPPRRVRYLGLRLQVMTTARGRDRAFQAPAGTGKDAGRGAIANELREGPLPGRPGAASCPSGSARPSRTSPGRRCARRPHDRVFDEATRCSRSAPRSKTRSIATPTSRSTTCMQRSDSFEASRILTTNRHRDRQRVQAPAVVRLTFPFPGRGSREAAVALAPAVAAATHGPADLAEERSRGAIGYPAVHSQCAVRAAFLAARSQSR